MYIKKQAYEPLNILIASLGKGNQIEKWSGIKPKCELQKTAGSDPTAFILNGLNIGIKSNATILSRLGS
jgi:hypothetical protein